MLILTFYALKKRKRSISILFISLLTDLFIPLVKQSICNFPWVSAIFDIFKSFVLVSGQQMDPPSVRITAGGDFMLLWENNAKVMIQFKWSVLKYIYI